MRSSEPLFWPLGQGPREDLVGVAFPTPPQQSRPVEAESVLPSDSVSQVGSMRTPPGLVWKNDSGVGKDPVGSSSSRDSIDNNVRPSVEIPEIERRISSSLGSSLGGSTSSDHSRPATISDEQLEGLKLMNQSGQLSAKEARSISSLNLDGLQHRRKT